MCGVNKNQKLKHPRKYKMSRDTSKTELWPITINIKFNKRKNIFDSSRSQNLLRWWLNPNKTRIQIKLREYGGDENNEIVIFVKILSRKCVIEFEGNPTPRWSSKCKTVKLELLNLSSVVDVGNLPIQLLNSRTLSTFSWLLNVYTCEVNFCFFNLVKAVKPKYLSLVKWNNQ